MEKKVSLRNCEAKDEKEYIKMNLEFMESVRREHPYWDSLKLPSEDEMKTVFHEALASPKDIRIFIIEEEGISIGYANTWEVYSVWTMGKALIIDDLYIKEEFRNKGYGKKVMQDLISYAASNGFKRIQLNAETDNSIAQALYKKVGFAGEEMVFFMKKLS